MTNKEYIEAYDNREFARFLASVAANKEEVDFLGELAKSKEAKGRKRGCRWL